MQNTIYILNSFVIARKFKVYELYIRTLYNCSWIIVPIFPLQWFRDEVSKEEQMPEELLSLLFSHLDPIYELHCSFLKDIEQRMATWYVVAVLHVFDVSIGSSGRYKKRTLLHIELYYWLDLYSLHRLVRNSFCSIFFRVHEIWGSRVPKGIRKGPKNQKDLKYKSSFDK